MGSECCSRGVRAYLAPLASGEFEVTTLALRVKRWAPVRMATPETKLSMEDPGIQNPVLEHLLERGVVG